MITTYDTFRINLAEVLTVCLLAQTEALILHLGFGIWQDHAPLTVFGSRLSLTRGRKVREEVHFLHVIFCLTAYRCAGTWPSWTRRTR